MDVFKRKGEKNAPETLIRAFPQTFLQLIAIGERAEQRLRCGIERLQGRTKINALSTFLHYEKVGAHKNITVFACQGEFEGGFKDEESLLAYFKNQEIMAFWWELTGGAGPVCLAPLESPTENNENLSFPYRAPEMLVPFCQFLPPSVHLLLPGTEIMPLSIYVHEIISTFTQQTVFKPELVGIVNVTPNSFSDGGIFLDPQKAIRHILRLVKEGASVIDIGGQSTRPGGSPVSPEEEVSRLLPVFKELSQLDTLKKQGIQVSLDTYYPEVVEAVLATYDIDWINDVTGFKKSKMADLLRTSRKKGVVMHALDVPVVPIQTLPLTCDPMAEVMTWLEGRVAHLMNLGIERDNLIIDPGIGFGKTLQQSLLLATQVDRLRLLNVKILVGHSRKVFLKMLTNARPTERDLESAIVAAFYYASGAADYIRVHNVEWHRQACVTATHMRGAEV